jgi:NAD(P)H-dependent FMN reductase
VSPVSFSILYSSMEALSRQRRGKTKSIRMLAIGRVRATDHGASIAGQAPGTADGLLLVTPEYHNAMPGVGKNASAWLSRPPQVIPRVFGGRPVARMRATPGGLGTVHAQTAWLPGFRTLGLPPWFGTLLYGSGAARVFDASGTLLDEQMRKRELLYALRRALTRVMPLAILAAAQGGAHLWPIDIPQP